MAIRKEEVTLWQCYNEIREYIINYSPSDILEGDENDEQPWATYNFISELVADHYLQRYDNDIGGNRRKIDWDPPPLEEFMRGDIFVAGALMEDNMEI